MINCSLGWIAKQIDGKLSTESVSDMPISNVSTDTRDLKSGDLFIALVGDNFDGHEYALKALEKGACAIVASRVVNTPLPTIIVKDTKQALGALGAAVKQKVNPLTIGITGSSGKTTVKEMTASILKECGKTLSTKGNFNNDIGVPLTLLELQEDDKFAVIEMGANHQGEIEYTSQLVKPDVATIVNAAPSHLQGFGSLFGVARAKSEIFSTLDEDKKAIINTDSQFYEFWRGKSDHSHILTFSPNSRSGDFHATNVSINEQGCAEFELVTPEGKVPIRLRVPGKHNVGNAVLAAALAQQVGAGLSAIQTGLFNMRSVSGRLSVSKIGENVRLLDDTYNANVASVKAAIDLLSTYKGPRIFVFGDMGELGDQAVQYHQDIGEYAVEKEVDALISLGDLSQHASKVLDGQGLHCNSVEEVIQQLENLVFAAAEAKKLPVNILVKGSRSARMERVSEAITNNKNFSQKNLKSSPTKESGSC